MRWKRLNSSPVAMENVTLPFRFKGVHTLRLIEWDTSKDNSEFRRLVEDISRILRPGGTATVVEAESAARGGYERGDRFGFELDEGSRCVHPICNNTEPTIKA